MTKQERPPIPVYTFSAEELEELQVALRSRCRILRTLIEAKTKREGEYLHPILEQAKGLLARLGGHD